MNNELLNFAKNRLKEDGYFDEDGICGGLAGEYVLELFEAFLDQEHDKETFEFVPKIFFSIFCEMKNQS